MPVWRMQVESAADSVLARDVLMINPHFNDAGATTDPQGLCDELATAMATYYDQGRQIEVTAYDAQGTKPVAPQGYAIRNLGQAPPSHHPRETACCLSFYSQFNRARFRGRLYVPVNGIFGSAMIGVRPASTLMTKVGQLATVLADLGGLDVDWCVFSRADNQARPVTNWWVDNEWDTVRSRGLRATTRIQGTTSEA